MRFIPLLALSLAMGVAGCAGGHVDSYNRSVDSVHQPVVQRHDYIVDVIAGDQGLAPGEASRLDGWFESLHARYGDHVAVDTGAASNQAAASAIASVAASHGLRLSYHAPVTQGALAAGAVRVVLSRMTASVPGCPDQHEGILAQFNAATSTNYGCATNASLAAMVANPEDLVRGQDGAGSAYSTNQVNAAVIQTYYGAVGKKVNQVITQSSQAGGN